MEESNYIKLLKEKPLRNVKIEPNARIKALAKQKNRCAKCKQEINRAFATFIENPTTKKWSVLCHNCAIESKYLDKKKK